MNDQLSARLVLHQGNTTTTITIVEMPTKKSTCVSITITILYDLLINVNYKDLGVEIILVFPKDVFKQEQPQLFSFCVYVCVCVIMWNPRSMNFPFLCCLSILVFVFKTGFDFHPCSLLCCLFLSTGLILKLVGKR